MRYPPSLLDEIRARLPVSAVVARKVALKKAGREFRGLSPFKAERTPSFFVNDQKGFYHCFATGEHGDIFKFVMATEGLSFPEAVERLAQEAGVSLPKPNQRDEAREDQRLRLYTLMEAACAFYTAQLLAPEGRAALRYIEGRGLSRNTIERFRLGFAPAGRSAIKSHLAAAGFSEAEMAASGMIVHGADIPTSYDRFRNRVMFPITDLKERVVAFGGRALEKEVPAKYLNSPETPLFHKGGMLFNAAKARSSAYDRGQIIVVEGYMDVIALSQAGFHETVAPLGTALTPDQLGLLWRFCPEPTLCFDGDTAGRKAAYRAIDTALPLLKPGHSLKFAFLPDGLDPDDLVRRDGDAAMQQVIERARPLADVLWEREYGASDWSTPERRARLEQHLRVLTGRIEDQSVRGHYEQAIRERLQKAFGGRPVDNPSGGRSGWRAGNGGQFQHGKAPQRGRWQARGSVSTGRGAGNGPTPVQGGASSSLRQSLLAADGRSEPSYREALLLRTLVNHPWLIDDDADAIADLFLQNRSLVALRDAVLQAHAVKSPLDREELRDQLRVFGQEKALALVDRTMTHRCDRFAEADASPDQVVAGWRDTLALHSQADLRRRLDAAEQAWFRDGTEEAYARLRDLTETLNGGRLALLGSDSEGGASGTGS